MTTGRASKIHIWYHICIKTATLYLDEKTYDRFKSYAERTGRPASELIREAMAEYAERSISGRESIFDGEPHRADAILRDLNADDDRLGEMLS